MKNRERIKKNTERQSAQRARDLENGIVSLTVKIQAKSLERLDRFVWRKKRSKGQIIDFLIQNCKVAEIKGPFYERKNPLKRVSKKRFLKKE